MPSILLHRQRLLPHCIFLLGILPDTATLCDTSFYRLQLIYGNRHWSRSLISLPRSCSCACSEMCERCSVAGRWQGLLPLSVAFFICIGWRHLLGRGGLSIGHTFAKQHHVGLFWFHCQLQMCLECPKQMQWPNVLYLPLSSRSIRNP